MLEEEEEEDSEPEEDDDEDEENDNRRRGGRSTDRVDLAIQTSLSGGESPSSSSSGPRFRGQKVLSPPPTSSSSSPYFLSPHLR